MKIPRRSALIALCLLSAAACGEDSTGPGNPSPEAILANLRTTNLNESEFPWTGIASGVLKRWSGDTLIPVKLNGSTLAAQALDEIEAALERTIFDRTSLDQVPDEQVTVGLIVSEGTSIGPRGIADESSCGHVSEGLGTTAYPQGFYDFSGRIETRLYVHISSARCTADLDVAIHEFGHALGMGQHFAGFGIGPAISGDFWNVLYTIYDNPAGTPESGITTTAIR
jgi:hypothetical protein